MKRVLLFVLAFVLGMGTFAVIKNVGDDSGPDDTEIIEAVRRTEEVSLVSLAIQGIKTERKTNSKIFFGIDIPLTSKTLFLKYSFAAKLGVDGAKVKVTKTAANSYLITIPKFTFIGYDDPTFEIAAEKGGALSWARADIDATSVVNEILSEKAQRAYLVKYDELLRAQTRVFYDSLIHGIDPAITTTFKFA